MKRLLYRLTIVLYHQPDLLRWAGMVLRRWPMLAGRFRILAEPASVIAAFHRPASLTNASKRPYLPAGEFAIGMEPGPRHDVERAFLKRLLPPAEQIAGVCSDEVGQRLAWLRARLQADFDLVDDYLRPVVWRAIQLTLGPVADRFTDAREDQRAWHLAMDQLACLATHMVTGPSEPATMTARTQRAAASLRRSISQIGDALETQFHQADPPDTPSIARNAAGLMMVAHPATVQAGALMMQELLARPVQYARLRAQAAQAASQGKSAQFRESLRDEVLDLLKARPPFPILVRAVPRDTWIDVGNGRAYPVRAGASVKLLTAAAMDDQCATGSSGADAGCPAGAGPADMVFGLGGHDCIGREQALQILVCALAGLLELGPLRYHDGWLRRIRYEGVRIKRMRLIATSAA